MEDLVQRYLFECHRLVCLFWERANAQARAAAYDTDVDTWEEAAARAREYNRHSKFLLQAEGALPC